MQRIVFHISDDDLEIVWDRGKNNTAFICGANFPDISAADLPSVLLAIETIMDAQAIEEAKKPEEVEPTQCAECSYLFYPGTLVNHRAGRALCLRCSEQYDEAELAK